MRYFRMKNFETFQHYKDRNPPWIKLHRSLLDDYEFTRLPDATKAHIMLIWLLGSQLGGRIPDDAEFVAKKTGARKLPDLGSLSEAGWLIPEPQPEPGAVQPPDSTHDPTAEQDASVVLAHCKQDASETLAFARSQEERRTTTEERQSAPARELAEPTTAHRTLAAELGVNCDAEWASFNDRIAAKGKPWFTNKGAAFSGWLRQERKYAERDGRLPSLPAIRRVAL